MQNRSEFVANSYLRRELMPLPATTHSPSLDFDRPVIRPVTPPRRDYSAVERLRQQHTVDRLRYERDAAVQSAFEAWKRHIRAAEMRAYECEQRAKEMADRCHRLEEQLLQAQAQAMSLQIADYEVKELS